MTMTAPWVDSVSTGGSITGGYVYCNINTGNWFDVLVVDVYVESADGQAPGSCYSVVAQTQSLPTPNFVQIAQVQGTNCTLQRFWAYTWPTENNRQIRAYLTGNYESAVITVTAIAGVQNPNLPLDTNSSLPATYVNPTSGASATPVFSGSVNASSSLLLLTVGASSGWSPPGSVPSGWTNVANASSSTGSGSETATAVLAQNNSGSVSATWGSSINERSGVTTICGILTAFPGIPNQTTTFNGGASHTILFNNNTYLSANSNGQAAIAQSSNPIIQNTYFEINLLIQGNSAITAYVGVCNDSYPYGASNAGQPGALVSGVTSGITLRQDGGIWTKGTTYGSSSGYGAVANIGVAVNYGTSQIAWNVNNGGWSGWTNINVGGMTWNSLYAVAACTSGNPCSLMSCGFSRNAWMYSPPSGYFSFDDPAPSTFVPVIMWGSGHDRSHEKKILTPIKSDDGWMRDQNTHLWLPPPVARGHLSV